MKNALFLTDFAIYGLYIANALQSLSPDLNFTGEEIDMDDARRSVGGFAVESDDLHCALRFLYDWNRGEGCNYTLITKLHLESALSRPQRIVDNDLSGPGVMDVCVRDDDGLQVGQHS